MNNKTSYSYYKIETGCYPDIIKLCFTKEQFQDILIDHNVKDKINPLEEGQAETHMIDLGDNRQIIVVIFDLDTIYKYGIDGLAGVVSHECSHMVDMLAEYIGEESNLTGGETRAYLTEYFVNQIFKACILERDKNVGKRIGKKITEGRGKAWWDLFQVDQHSVGSAGQNSVPEDQSVLRGDEDPIWKGITQTGTRIQDTRKSRVPRGNIKKRGRH